MKNRDEFSKRTKTALALRARYLCSFTACQRPTAGPSDESLHAVNITGVAAHIHAAAPLGRRYLQSMSAEERSDINNAIWLCSDHAMLIDRDDVAYTAEALQAMKRDHEANCVSENKNRSTSSACSADLFAIGPDIVCIGEIIKVDASEWELLLRNFVVGDMHALNAFIGGFQQTAVGDRYILVNADGDGRALKDAPSVVKKKDSYFVRCPLFPSFPRILATNLPKTFALSDNHDLTAGKNGNIAEVLGLEALPQNIKTVLSHQKGESPFHQDYGTRLAEYYEGFHGSPWFDRLVKLEVIRLAAIPYSDPGSGQQYTPLQCVNRVYDIEILAETTVNKWLPIRVDLDVEGVGRWQRELSICVPRLSELRAARKGWPLQ